MPHFVVPLTTNKLQLCISIYKNSRPHQTASTLLDEAKEKQGFATGCRIATTLRTELTLATSAHASYHSRLDHFIRGPRSQALHFPISKDVLLHILPLIRTWHVMGHKPSVSSIDLPIEGGTEESVKVKAFLERSLDMASNPFRVQKSRTLICRSNAAPSNSIQERVGVPYEPAMKIEKRKNKPSKSYKFVLVDTGEEVTSPISPKGPPKASSPRDATRTTHLEVI